VNGSFRLTRLVALSVFAASGTHLHLSTQHDPTTTHRSRSASTSSTHTSIERRADTHDGRQRSAARCTHHWVGRTWQRFRTETGLSSDAALGGVVKISIGPDKKMYNVHKNLICHHSEYFRTAYNGHWKEAEDGVALDDINPAVFNIFVHWLYAQEVPSAAAGLFRIAGVTPKEEIMLKKESHSLAIKAYVFGDRFMASRFKCLLNNWYVDEKQTAAPYYEDVIYAFSHLKGAVAFGDRFVATEFEKAAHNYFITQTGANLILYELVIYAYKHLREDNRILDNMVDTQSCLWSDEDTDDEVAQRSSLPVRFLVDVMRRQLEFRHGPDTWDEDDFDLCTYHLHDSPAERLECPKYHRDRVLDNEKGCI